MLFNCPDVRRNERIDKLAVAIARKYFHPEFFGAKEMAMMWAYKKKGYEEHFKKNWESFNEGMFMKSEE